MIRDSAYVTLIDPTDTSLFSLPSDLIGGVAADSTFATAVAASIFAGSGQGMKGTKMRTCVLHGWQICGSATTAWAGNALLGVYDIRGAGTLLYLISIGANTNQPPKGIRLPVSAGIGFKVAVAATAASRLLMSWDFED